VPIIVGTDRPEYGRGAGVRAGPVRFHASLAGDQFTDPCQSTLDGYTKFGRIHSRSRQGIECSPLLIGRGCAMTLTTENPSNTGARFVGRAREIRSLRDAVRALDAGDQVTVEVVGEPGIGKTSLVREALAGCGVPVAAGTGTEVERRVPFHVFRQAFGRPLPADVPPHDPGLDDPDLADAERGPLPDGVARASLDARRFRTYQALRRLLARGAARGLALVLDDLHWADRSSTELIHHLLRHPVPAPLLLVLVYRPRQMAVPAPFGLAAPAEAAWARPGGPACRIELGPLSARESAELLGEPADSAGLLRRHEESAGNPLYLAATGHGGSGSDADAVLARLLPEWTVLPMAELAVLATAAVLGERFDTPLLAAAAGLPARAVADATRRLARRDLLRPVAGAAAFTFRHPVVRAAVYRSTDPLWRLDAHRRALDALLRCGGPAAACAVHVEQLLAGPDIDRADWSIDVLLRAAEEAGHDAPEAAARWLRLALRAAGVGAPAASGDSVVDGPPGQLVETRELLQRILPLVPAGHDGRRAAAVASWARTEWLLGNYAEASAILRRELSTVLTSDLDPTPPARLRQLAAEFSAVAILSGRTRAVSRLVEGVASGVEQHVRKAAPAEGVRPDGAGADWADLLAARGLAAVHDGHVEQARELVAAGIPVVDGLPDADLVEHPNCLVTLGLTEMFLERYADAARHLDRGLALARRFARDHTLPQILLGRCQVAYYTGRLATASDLARQAGAAARRNGGRDLLCFALSFEAEAAMCRAQPSDGGRAVELARAAVALAPDREGWPGRTAAMALAQATLAAGDHRGCAEQVLDAGGDEDLSGLQASQRPMWYRLLCDAALAAGDLAAAGRWADLGSAAADRLGLPGQRGFAESGRAGLLLARGLAAEAAALFQIAAGRFRRQGMALQEGLALAGAANAAEAAGDTGPAAQHRRRALDIADWCGSALVASRLREPSSEPAPALPFPPGLEPLTERERQIAMLAATGATTRAIGRALTISPRTVEAHLSRIYRKLELPSRAALVALVARS
jgi:DNA-binding CsgD family transcriptional regulator/tetratricopeptide (TPR) repeat protein